MEHPGNGICVCIHVRRGPPPPPIFWGTKQGGQKPHTQKKKSKSDNHEARYMLKRTPKTLYTRKFSLKKYCEVGGGSKGPQGEIFCS